MKIKLSTFFVLTGYAVLIGLLAGFVSAAFWDHATTPTCNPELTENEISCREACREDAPNPDKQYDCLNFCTSYNWRK